MEKVNFKPATTANKHAKEAEENRLSHYSHQQEMKNLKKVFQLPPDFRYSAAKDFGLLKWYKHKHNGMSYQDDRLWNNDELTKEFIEEFERIAYRKIDWGRKQNIRRGSRTLNCPETMGIKSSLKGGWTSYDYYSDFSVFFNRKNPEILFSYDNKVFKINVIETPVSLMKYKHVADAEPFKSSNLVWDAKEIAFSLEDEVYHIKENEVYQTQEGVQKLFDRVSNALAQRVKEKKERKQRAELFANLPDSLVVSVQHSLNAGNCVVGTEQFRKRHGLTEKDAYTIAELKEKGVDFSNEMFRRAILQAAK